MLDVGKVVASAAGAMGRAAPTTSGKGGAVKEGADLTREGLGAASTILYAQERREKDPNENTSSKGDLKRQEAGVQKSGFFFPKGYF